MKHVPLRTSTQHIRHILRGVRVG